MRHRLRTIHRYCYCYCYCYCAIVPAPPVARVARAIAVRVRTRLSRISDSIADAPCSAYVNAECVTVRQRTKMQGRVRRARDGDSLRAGGSGPSQLATRFSQFAWVIAPPLSS